MTSPTDSGPSGGGDGDFLHQEQADHIRRANEVMSVYDSPPSAPEPSGADMTVVSDWWDDARQAMQVIVASAALLPDAESRTLVERNIKRLDDALRVANRVASRPVIPEQSGEDEDEDADLVDAVYHAGIRFGKSRGSEVNGEVLNRLLSHIASLRERVAGAERENKRIPALDEAVASLLGELKNEMTRVESAERELSELRERVERAERTREQAEREVSENATRMLNAAMSSVPHHQQGGSQ